MQDDLAVDGNSAAGALEEVLAVEMTTARATCVHCGAVEQLGVHRAYDRAPGTVVRCIHCDGVLIRIAGEGTRRWLDLRGVRSLEIRLETP